MSEDIIRPFEEKMVSSALLEIPTPRAYLMDEYGKYRANERVKHPYAWAKGTVNQILSNPVYLGKLVSLRYQTRSFKDKRIIPRPETDWRSP